MPQPRSSRLSPLYGIAAGQHGVITRAQALHCGVTRHQITGLVRRGRWRRLHTGVYLVRPAGGDPEPPLAARVMAA
ncbi:type IV toxin-antitoxin system AbiEi family antitoxin domain-containing protein, partial [Streptomonospora algeriensis]